MASVAPKLLTVEEFASLPQPPDGSREELVRGVVITMPPPRFRHGKHQGRIFLILDQFVNAHGLGQVLPETGVITERDPDSVRGPDVVYWSFERLPRDQEVEVYPEVAPDLCVEVLSPGEGEQRKEDKLREYLTCGVRMVWYVDPKNRTVSVHRPGRDELVLTAADMLSGEDVLPGFSCPVADLFP
jgi:Uma2 family endonuclease